MTENEKTMIDILNMYEEELKHYMSEEEYMKFSDLVAKSVFLKSVKRIKNKSFRKTILDNFDAITGSDAEFEKALYELKKKRNDEE